MTCTRLYRSQRLYLYLYLYMSRYWFKCVQHTAYKIHIPMYLQKLYLIINTTRQECRIWRRNRYYIVEISLGLDPLHQQNKETKRALVFISQYVHVNSWSPNNLCHAQVVSKPALALLFSCQNPSLRISLLPIFPTLSFSQPSHAILIPNNGEGNASAAILSLPSFSSPHHCKWCSLLWQEELQFAKVAEETPTWYPGVPPPRIKWV